MFNFEEKNVLIAGGTGLVGMQLTPLLLKAGAKVRIASLDDPSRVDSRVKEFLGLDLMDFGNCLTACQDMDYVFNLLGLKGSPTALKENPATYFDVNLILANNLMRAAKDQKVRGFLYTSTNGIYGPSQTPRQEEEAWVNPPTGNDRGAGFAKLMGELQAELYMQQHKLDICVVRPANIYGPYDNFHAASAMVIPSLIRRACSENPLVVLGSGTGLRDFVHAADVASGMLFFAKNNPKIPINLGSGRMASIKELVEIIVANLDPKPEVAWNPSRGSGGIVKGLDITRAKSYGWNPLVSLEDGIRETLHWYKDHVQESARRFDLLGTP